MSYQINNLETIILAAGKGTRMNSETPKVLHQIQGKPMIFYVIKKFLDLGVLNITVVVGHKAEEVKETINFVIASEAKQSLEIAASTSSPRNDVIIKFANQQEALGTADALKSALPHLDNQTKMVMVVNGDDSAFYKEATLENFTQSHIDNEAIVSAITLEKDDPKDLGRIIRDGNGEFLKTLESKEFADSGFESNEINCGAYIFELDWLKENIAKVPVSQKGEYYINELLNIAKEQGKKVNLFKLEDPNEWHGVNTLEDLEKAQNKIL